MAVVRGMYGMHMYSGKRSASHGMPNARLVQHNVYRSSHPIGMTDDRVHTTAAQQHFSVRSAGASHGRGQTEESRAGLRLGVKGWGAVPSAVRGEGELSKAVPPCSFTVTRAYVGETGRTMLPMCAKHQHPTRTRDGVTRRDTKWHLLWRGRCTTIISPNR